MWRGLSTGGAVLAAGIEKDRPFAGNQSQRISYVSGEGEVGIENEGLNRWGMNFVEGKEYEGYLWMKADKTTEVFASLKSRDGGRQYDQTRIAVGGNEWKKYSFSMMPIASDL